MNQGYIKLHRKMLDWEWWEDINTFRLFMYLLLKANHADKNWKGVLISRGSLITSLPILSAKTRLTVREVRTCLTRLKSTGEVTDVSSPKGRVITINNYERYQQDDRLLDRQATDDRQANDRLTTANNNDNNDKEYNNNNYINPNTLSVGSTDTGKKVEKKKTVFKYTLTMLREDITEIVGKTFKARKPGAKASKQDVKDATQLKQRLEEGASRQDFRDLLFNIKRDNHHRDSGYKWINTEFVTRPAMFSKWLEAGKGEPKKPVEKPKEVVVKAPEEPKKPEDPRARATWIVKGYIEGAQKDIAFQKNSAYRLGFDLEELKQVNPEGDISKYVDFYLEKTSGKVISTEGILKSIS